MADDIYGLTIDQMERLRRTCEIVEKNSPPSPTGLRRPPLQSSKIMVGILTDPIAATTSLIGKPKVGTLNVYSFSSTGVTDTGIDETVYSFAPTAATTDRWAVAERDAVTGLLILTTQFCS